MSAPRITQNDNETNRKRKSVFDEEVPPLELIADISDDVKIDEISKHETSDIKNEINKTTKEIVTNELATNPPCEPNDNTNNSQNTNHNNASNSSNTTTSSSAPPNPSELGDIDTSYSLSSNGRLLASEEEWYTRAKVTFSGTDNGQMAFRPLRMKCTHCDEAYTKTHDLYAHIRSHQNHTKCPHCGKTLTCMATFVYHVRTHTAEKPYYCPCDGCDFKNAVKYNLKVHLACIRHGGKDNLKKYAKVLDLDVCEKSLRKRKDNSVHELGSRRSKKRRKLNSGHMVSGSMNICNSQAMNHYYPKQEPCDQFTEQLLFNLSGIPSVFDQTISMNRAGMTMDWITAHQQSHRLDGSLKPELYYDPMYGYYAFVPNTAMTSSLSTSPIWSEEHAKMEIKQDQNGTDHCDVLIPKQEPMYPQAHGGVDYSYYNRQSSMPYQQQMLMAGNPYYGNGYYFNYGSEQYPNNANQITMQQNHNSNNNNNKFELPPLQFSESELNKMQCGY